MLLAFRRGFSNDEKDEIKKFLQDCKDNDLIRFPNPELSDLFLRTERNAEIDSLAQHALYRVNNVYQKMGSEERNNFIPRDNFKALQISSSISQLQNNTEELKTFLKAIMNPDRIDSNQSMLGAYMRSIYDELQYSPEKRKRMNELLNVDLRNALNHNDYEMRLDGFSYTKRNGEIMNLTVEELLDLMIKNSEIHEVLSEFINQLKKELGLS